VVEVVVVEGLEVKEVAYTPYRESTCTDSTCICIWFTCAAPPSSWHEYGWPSSQTHSRRTPGRNPLGAA